MLNSINTSPSGNEQQLHSELRAIGHQLLNLAHKLMAIDAMLTFNKQDAHSPLPEAHSPKPESPKLKEAIIQTICQVMQTTISQIQSPSRKRNISDTRCLVSYFLIKYSGLTRNQIIDVMNIKNHTAIIAHLKKVSQLQAFNKAFADKKNKIENLISKL